jgi:hypothetical protein
VQSFKQYIYENTLDKEKVVRDLQNFLQGGLKPYAADFVAAGVEYNIDPYLTASIAMLETGRGTSSSFKRNNSVGGAWDPKTKTHKYYSNVKSSIFDQARFLKSGYINQGLNTIPAIGAKYAPPGASNDPNGTNAQWPQYVSSFYKQATGSSVLLAGGSFTGQGAPAMSPADFKKTDYAAVDSQVPPKDEEDYSVGGAIGKIFGGISDIAAAAKG